jgi:hypothetical protein
MNAIHCQQYYLKLIYLEIKIISGKKHRCQFSLSKDHSVFVLMSIAINSGKENQSILWQK